jgi:transcription elongation factor Elf1
VIELGAMADLSDAPLDFRCPKCGYQFFETVGWVQRNENINCPGCSGVLNLNLPERATLADIFKALDDLERGH